MPLLIGRLDLEGDDAEVKVEAEARQLAAEAALSRLEAPLGAD